jgi:hypothetical protein
MRVSAVRPKLCSPTKGLNSRRTYSYAVVSTPFQLKLRPLIIQWE